MAEKPRPRRRDAAFPTEAHDWVVERTLTLVEVRAVETRVRVPESGRMIRVGGQKAVIAKGRLTPALQKGLSEGIGNAR